MTPNEFSEWCGRLIEAGEKFCDIALERKYTPEEIDEVFVKIREQYIGGLAKGSDAD